jgi:hypothetical protein
MADANTTTYNLVKPEVGSSADTWGGKLNDNFDSLDNLLDGTTAIKPNLTASEWKVGGVAVTATAAELNILDGVTATAAELNYVDVTTLGTSEASKAVTADANGNIILSEEVQAKSFIETAVQLSGATPTVNCNAGNVFYISTTGNVTFTFDYSGIGLTTNDAYSMVIKVTQGGAYTLTWPATVDWQGGIAPDAPGASDTAIYVFFTNDGGTTWYGFQPASALS